MSVRFDHVTSGVPHVAELLRIAPGSKEMNARFMKIAAQDYCKFDVAECYALDHFQNSGLVAPFRRKHDSVMRLACLINDCGVGQHFHSCFEFLRNEEHTSQNADPIVVYSCGAIGVKVIRLFDQRSRLLSKRVSSLSIAGTPASMCPRVKKSIAPKCGYDGARILHLYGWLVPSETR